MTQKLIAFKLMERGIPRHDYKIQDAAGNDIGHVTSGTMSPTLGIPIGMGYVGKEYASIGNEIAVEIRNKSVKAEIVKAPFVNK